ncbi:hypothetical protein [Deefgea sp. CFH1-16]|uniref:hypothetical protein n=1 Tax=Deefgea sp. CFH1-16 TaxID=2675457 RepID=UPI0015F5B5A7|nr:hypothetical protein [Deefgea sp. CFH1-16]
MLQFEVLARNGSISDEPALQTESEPKSQVETSATPSAAQDPTLAMEIELALAAAAATENSSQPVMSAPNPSQVAIDSNAEYQPILSDDDLFVPHKKNRATHRLVGASQPIDSDDLGAAIVVSISTGAQPRLPGFTP